MKHSPSGRLLAAAFVSIASIVAMTASCAAPARPELVPGAYRSWRKTTEVRLDFPIPGHEDRYRVILMNDLGFAFKKTAGGGIEFPEGTVVAKEIYASRNPGPDDAPIMVTAMVKAPADPDARGGWLWVVKDLSNGKESVQKGDFCVRCHGNANEKHPYGSKNPDAAFSDYVFYVPGR